MIGNNVRPTVLLQYEHDEVNLGTFVSIKCGHPPLLSSPPRRAGPLPLYNLGLAFLLNCLIVTYYCCYYNFSGTWLVHRLAVRGLDEDIPTEILPNLELFGGCEPAALNMLRDPWDWILSQSDTYVMCQITFNVWALFCRTNVAKNAHVVWKTW